MGKFQQIANIRINISNDHFILCLFEIGGLELQVGLLIYNLIVIELVVVNVNRN